MTIISSELWTNDLCDLTSVMMVTDNLFCFNVSFQTLACNGVNIDSIQNPSVSTVGRCLNVNKES